MENELLPNSSEPANSEPGHGEALPFPLDDDFMQAAHARVVERLPDLASVIPEIRAKPPNVVFVYRVSAPLPDGHTLTRTTRATINATGKIIKLSTSRG